MQLPFRVSVTGFFVLSTATLVLFARVLAASIAVPGVVTISIAIILLGLIAGIVREAASIRTPEGTTASPDTTGVRTAAIDLSMVVVGNALTFVLSVESGLGPVVASSVVGLLAAMLVRKHATAVFCGSFVGMSSPDVYGYAGVVLFAGICAGVVFVAAKRVMNGFGGKLGTVAFTGALSASFLLQARLGSLPVPVGTDALWVLAYATVGAVVTYVLSVHLRNGPVPASAMVGLLSGLLLPVLHGPQPGTLFAVVAFCASFTGMSSPARLPTSIHIACAGLITGLVFLYASPFFDGAGGKLGTIAFGSSIAVWGLQQLRMRLQFVSGKAYH